MIQFQTVQLADMPEPITISEWVRVVDEGQCRVESIYVDPHTSNGVFRIEVEVMQPGSRSDHFFSVDIDQIEF